MVKRHEELRQVSARYQLAADRLENAVRDLAEARRSVTADEVTERTGATFPAATSIRDARDALMKSYQAAQNEYDEVCQLVSLVAPLKTNDAAIQPRQLFNRLTVEALNGAYDRPSRSIVWDGRVAMVRLPGGNNAGATGQAGSASHGSEGGSRSRSHRRWGARIAVRP